MTAAISAIPLERPSSPSMKFRLLIMPTIQTTVNAIPTGAAELDDARGPNGLPMNATVIPAATATAASASWPDELPARPEVEPIVEGADDVARIAPPKRPDEVQRASTVPEPGHPRAARRRTGTSPPPTTRKARATATPPPRGSG